MKLRGVAIGAGYFSDFHFDAWQRMPGVEIIGLCDQYESKAKSKALQYGIPNYFTSIENMLEMDDIDFIDIITPPVTHYELVKKAADKGLAIICQKPIAPDANEAVEMVNYAKKLNVPLMIHENFRFQPWHREIKKLLDQNLIGELNKITHFCRMGDGWGDDAYLARQPYFQDYKRLLIYETGIHFIDTYRFLAGEFKDVFAKLRRLNPVIKGEDSGMMVFEMESGVWITCDFSRFNESNAENARYTFGEFTFEGSKGTIRLYPDGNITIQKLGAKETKHKYMHNQIGFAGDCVYATQKHFIDSLINKTPFETSGEDYLKSLSIQERIYAACSI
ncbi:Predicted dehydrogenase [Spirosomataceae bacterium TFI 002]|nr:Predicted dehydrogenase [Spirosomataceae bacterium TFI 002]